MKNLIFVLSFIFGISTSNFAQIMGSKSDTRVLVIGISNYQDEKITDLKFAHKDAEAFATYMKSEAGGSLADDKIMVLKNEEATTAQIYSALDWLLEESQNKDKVIIYFSGHGDVETKTIRQRGYLLAHDTPSNNYRVGAVRLEDLNDVLATLAQVNEAQITLITDACHSGNLAGSSINGTQATATALTTQFANEVKIMSCQPNELSLEGIEWGNGRGVFSYHLIEGMIGLADSNDDGLVNLKEIERYLEDNVSEEVKPHSQSPMTVGDKNTRIAIVDEGTLENLKLIKSEQQLDLATIASKGSNVESTVENDTNAIELFADFTVALENKYFLPSDNDGSRKAGKSASELYDILSKEKTLQPVHNIMKRDFAAALQDEAQQAIIAYLNTDAEEMEERWKNYGAKYNNNPKYLSKAAGLLGNQHYMYDQLLAKQYYFEGLIDRLKAEQNSDKALYDQAYQKVKKALSYDDQAAYVYNELGLIKQGQRNFKIARNFYDTAMMIAPTWVLPSNNLCHLYKILHQYDKAESFGKKAIELKPDYFQAYYNLGLVYEGKKDFEQAKLMYKKAIEIKPDYKKALVNLGRLYYKEKSYDQAAPLFQKVIQLDSTYYLGWYYMGLNHLDNKAYEKAAVHFKKAYDLHPNNHEICDNLGYAYYKTKQYDQAETYYLKAQALNTSFEQVYKELNWLYIKTKEWEKAENNLLNWLKINPDRALSYYDLACFKSIQGNIDKGLEYLEKSFQKGYEDLNNIKSDPHIESLRKTDDFQNLLKQYFSD